MTAWRWRRGRGLAGLLLVAIVGVGCTGPALDRAAAERLATAFVAAQAPPGTTMERVEVDSVSADQRAGRPGWVVEASGTPMRPGGQDGVAYHYWLWINGTTGEVTIEGQG